MVYQIVKSRATPKEGNTEVELDLDEGSTPRSMTALFGRWQTEAWQPARAVGGIVPRVRSIMAIVPEVARQSLS